MNKKTQIELSREYYRFVENFTKTELESKKLLGKFYTDHEVGLSMMSVIAAHFSIDDASEELRIIDPFCGDGRLIILLLSALLEKGKLASTPLFISIWDIDAAAVEKARWSVMLFCKEHGLNYRIDAQNTDTFVEYDKVRSSYDICVTNPPWTLLKPQKIFSKSNSAQAIDDYRKVTEQYDSLLKVKFAAAQPSRKFGKWGTNLAHCGTELALSLIKHNGFCGIVSPVSLLNDQVSEGLRGQIFEDRKILNISYYPAELKLYGSADVSSVTIVLTGGRTEQAFDVMIYSDKSTYAKKTVNSAALDFIRQNGYVLPLQTGMDAIPIMMSLDKLPTTESFCKDMQLYFKRELDETQVQKKLIFSGNIEFAKGYMVDRYSFKGDGLFINESAVALPASVLSPKLVWRDVSRNSQVRRIRATLLPRGYVCGNSLGMICGDADKIPHMKMLLAVMNSMIYEYQAKSLLISNHISAGIVKKLRIPHIIPNSHILDLVDRQLKGEDVEELIELAVAHLYDISPDNYTIIVESFDIPQETKEQLIKKFYDEKAEKRKT